MRLDFPPMSRSAIWIVALAFVAFVGLIVYFKPSPTIRSSPPINAVTVSGDAARAVEAVRDSLGEPATFALIRADRGVVLKSPTGNPEQDGQEYIIVFRHRNEVGGWSRSTRRVHIWPNEKHPTVLDFGW